LGAGRHTEEERRILREQAERRAQARYEREEEINKRFRRSPLFVATFCLRVFFLLFFCFIFFFEGGPVSYSEETVVFAEKGVYLSTGAGIKVMKLDVVTDVAFYSLHFESGVPPALAKGDHILIGRNIFNKPSRLNKATWKNSHAIALNWPLYIMAVLITIISLSFNDNTDRITEKVIWVAWTIDIIALLCYFVW
jgi:hypothetical protein